MAVDLFSVDELLTRWRGTVSKDNLAHWRVDGKGPRFIKIGRAVLYPEKEVEEFERKNTSP